MTVQSENERNKAVVDEYFKAGVEGHLMSFAAYLHPDGTDAIIKIVDHWTLRDGKAISLWAAYFEPQAVLEKLGIKRTVDGGMNAEQKQKALRQIEPNKGR